PFTLFPYCLSPLPPCCLATRLQGYRAYRDDLCSFLEKQVNFAHMIDPVATPLGFEPRITPPKGAVLPLHHGVIGWPTYDSRRRNGSCNSGGRTTRDFAGNDRYLVTFGNRQRLPYNLNLGRGAIPAVWAGECQSWCRCRRHWKAKFFRHALPPPIGQWRGQDRCRSIFRAS